MPLEVQVGPPTLTINRGKTFLVSELDGSVSEATKQGLFSNDTRYVSRYQLYLDGYRWTLLNSGAIAYYAERVYMINPAVPTERGSIREGVLGLTLGRIAHEGIHEDIDIHNYGAARAHFNLELLLRSDFADIFEVKAKRFLRRGSIDTQWSDERQELINAYVHEDFQRSVVLRIKGGEGKARYANGRITFPIDLEPGASWHTCCLFQLNEGSRAGAVPQMCIGDLEKSNSAVHLVRWKEATTAIKISTGSIASPWRTWRRCG